MKQEQGQSHRGNDRNTGFIEIAPLEVSNGGESQLSLPRTHWVLSQEGCYYLQWTNYLGGGRIGKDQKSGNLSGNCYRSGGWAGGAGTDWKVQAGGSSTQVRKGMPRASSLSHWLGIALVSGGLSLGSEVALAPISVVESQRGHFKAPRTPAYRESWLRRLHKYEDSFSYCTNLGAVVLFYSFCVLGEQ